MKAHLIDRDRDFDPEAPLPDEAAELVQDLELDTVLDAMAAGDGFLRGVARAVLLARPRADAEAVRYRQAVLADCLAQLDTVRAIHALSVEALEAERRGYFGIFAGRPASILSGSIEILKVFATMLRRLRDIVREAAPGFRSEGFRTFFAALEAELDDVYLAEIDRHLADLRFGAGVVISAGLDGGGKGRDFVLRTPREADRHWLNRVLGPHVESYSFQIAPRDEQGAQALAGLRDRGLNLVANAAAQSKDHILSFFTQIRIELGFYLACANLRAALPDAVPLAMPEMAGDAPGFACRGLCDVALALRINAAPVGNDIEAPARRLVIVTGANRGGKSTFLRSLGQAQLMAQAGMFVAAEDFRGAPCDGLFTHFKREEDAGMKSGKFDEELVRMSAIVDRLGPRSLVLFNESFAATNEREGSEVAARIVDALLAHGIRVVFVTHLYEFAHRYEAGARALFLRAGRNEDGSRSYRLQEGPPLATGYAADLYAKVFGTADTPA